MKITYIDKREVYIPQLKKYKGGYSLPNNKRGNTIEVTEVEAKHLMKMRNGNKPCFELEKKPVKKDIIMESDE